MYPEMYPPCVESRVIWYEMPSRPDRELRPVFIGVNPLDATWSQIHPSPLLTGGLLVRVQPEEPSFQVLDQACDQFAIFADHPVGTGGYFLRKWLNANRLRDHTPSICVRVRSIFTIQISRFDSLGC